MAGSMTRTNKAAVLPAQIITFSVSGMAGSAETETATAFRALTQVGFVLVAAST
jgi:hypothetical protein